MSEPLEDFAEINSIYITSSEKEWENIIANAGESGALYINMKLEILRAYMMDSWNIDIDEMRSIIIRRGNNLSNVDLETLN